MPRFSVARSTQIAASPDDVYQKVVDFGTWTTWSPWLCAEPDANVTVTSDPASVGSVYSWEGDLVGAGEIEHIELQPGSKIQEEIRFTKPFASKSAVGFDFAPAGDGTKITWQMDGSLPWFLFWMKGQMESMISMDYDRGLKMLKEWMETGKILSDTKIHGVDSVGPLRMAGVRKTSSLEGLGASMEKAFAEAAQKLPQHGLSIEGEGISVYHKFDIKTQTFEYTSGFVIPESSGSTGDLSVWEIPAVQALRVEHIGSYNHLGNSWSAAMQYARYKKLKQSKVGTFEIYRNKPEDTEEAELRTDIYVPLR